MSNAVPLPHPRSLVTLARFGTVGAVTAVAYVAGFAALVELGLRDTTASIAAYLAAIAIQFMGHRTFTFPTSARLGHSVARFVVANGLGLGFSTALVVTLRDGMGIGALTTGLIVTLAMASMNWVIFRKWVFRP